MARRLDAAVGDRVEGLRVVGIGVGPAVNNEHLGDLVLLPRPAFERLKLTEPFANALVSAAPGSSATALAAALGRDLEVNERFQPDEVRNLGELGRLPRPSGRSSRCWPPLPSPTRWWSPPGAAPATSPCCGPWGSPPVRRARRW